MEEFSSEGLPVKQDKKNLLLTSKDPHLSHLFGDDPRTPNSVGSSDQNTHSVMEDSGQFHDEESREPEYRLFEEQSYVPDLSPSNQMMMESSNCGSVSDGKSESQQDKEQKSLQENREQTRKAKSSADTNDSQKSNESTKVKPFSCKERGCGKAYTDPRSLRKHVIKFHSSDLNNNDIASSSANSEAQRASSAGKPTSVLTQSSFTTTSQTQSKSTLDSPLSTFTSVFNAVIAANHGRQENGPPNQRHPRNELGISLGSVGTSVKDGKATSMPATSFAPPSDTTGSNYNMQLLAHSAQQHLLQQQHVGQPPSVILHPPIDDSTAPNSSSASNFMNQSSSALQQLAMRVQMRDNSMQGTVQQESLSSALSVPMLVGGTVESSTHQPYMPAQSSHITGVRAQLRKTLSSSGKLESANSGEWPRMALPPDLSRTMTVGPVANPMEGQENMFLARVSPANDPSNIDNAPLLKDLLASNNRPQNIGPVKSNAANRGGLDQGNSGTYILNAISENTWQQGNRMGVNPNPGEQLASPNMQSPTKKANHTMFHYQHNPGDVTQIQSSPIPNPSPMNSPTYQHAPPFPSQHNQTTPLPQNNETQQFFSPDDIMVNNNNNQQMPRHDTSSTTLNDFIAESETLVQDLIDEANASSNQGTSQQMMSGSQNPFVQSSQAMQQPVRATPPPAYNLNPHTGLMDQDMTGQGGQMTQSRNNIYLGQNGNEYVKSEPQSPMLTSPVGQRMFFQPQSTALGHHPGVMQALASPTAPHPQMGMQGNMQPPTPTGDTQWQFPSSQNQNYVSVPQSPTAPPQLRPVVPVQDNQGMNKSAMVVMPYLSRQRSAGNSKPARVRRTSGGSARKNPDGTLSCAICGHSFRSVPALNGHMRVHSSSSDKKNKDERQRKASGSSNGGSGSKTPQTLSSPTTPTYKISTSNTMYQNAVTYNNVPTFTNAPALYNPGLNSVEGAGTMVAVSQHDARKPPFVHTIAAQTPISGLYPHAIPHPPPMQPQDALLAAVNLLERTDTDFMYARGPVSAQTGLPVPDLQNLHYITQQPAPGKLDLAGGYRKAPPPGMILVQSQPGVVPGYLPQHQSEQLQATNITTVPFVTLSSSVASLPMYRQGYVSSPPQEPNNPTPGDNVYLTVQQPLLQQTNHRSTPLADFADIAVAHNQGQLFCPNSMLVAPLGSNQLPQAAESPQGVAQQQPHEQRQQQPEQLQLQDVSSDVGLLASVSKDLLWHPDSQTSALTKMDRNEPLPLKEDDFLPSSMADIHNKSHNELPPPNQAHDPFIFPVSVPVHCSRDDPTVVTTTTNSFYPGHSYDDFSTHLSAFHDDPLMQEAINVANPSKILPNSMMGGNPSGPSFRSFRQRHHSEGSVLKKILIPDVPGLPMADDLKLMKTEFTSNVSGFPSNAPAFTLRKHEVEPLQKPPLPIAGNKRKNEVKSELSNPKKLKISLESSNSSTNQNSDAKAPSLPLQEKKEVWTVPKQAPPNRTRHRRHSADSRIPYRTGSLLRQSYPSPFSICGTGAPSRLPYVNNEQREKRRPPPLIIPASVNAYSSGATLYTSKLHHRRRPSGDSNSSCGNDKIPPYTPPPMLSPLRFGTGLYRTGPITPKALYRQGSVEHGGIETIPEEDVIDEELVRSADPKINIGIRYQAQLPDLLPRSKAAKDEHKAELVWKPPEDMKRDNSTQSRHVEEYMKLACSAAVPHGGCNKEFALHLLQKNNGDILSAVRDLLNKKVTVPDDHWMSSYYYMGSVRWSQRDRQNFDAAYMKYHKDFFSISKTVKTMTTAQCIDYYYHTVKRRKRRIQRPRRFRHDSEEARTFVSSPNGYDSYHSDDDFMQDHINEGQEVLERVNRDQSGTVEFKSAEVLRRSPTSTTFVRAPRPVAKMTNTPPPALIDFSPQIKQEHVPVQQYQRNQVSHLPQSHLTATAPSAPPAAPAQLYRCEMPSCMRTFQTPQQLIHHQQIHSKTMKPYLERVNRASPSPASSPSSVASADTDAPQPVFSCPRCGKTFGKVKSRNAHMKTHGKHAQEKRKQKEEEARRKMEEAAAWRNRQQNLLIPPTKAKSSILQFHIKPPGM